MSTAQQLAVLLAFAAFGANLLGGALLLLFNPHHPAVRWYVIFTGAQLGWLLLQGLQVLSGLTPFWWQVYSLTVHLMPALFFAATLVNVRPGGPAWLPYLPVAVALALLVVMPRPLASALSVPWHVVAWGGAALLYSRAERVERHSRRTPLHTLLLMIVPLGVIGAIAAGGGFVLFALPLMTIAIQFLIFSGIVHHRFYDIEVRAARSGELAAAAAQHDRLALLGELSATIAHEVRNPLTGMRSLTQLLAETPLDAEKRQRYADVILGEIGRLDRIVSNLVDLARRTSGSSASAPATFELPALFEDLALLVEPRARRHDVSLAVDTDGVGVVTAPRDALAQALLNLLINAIEHSPQGSTVRLTAAAASGGVALTILDQGPGVPPEDRARIFEPFHSSGGTGLGLAVARRLAQEHGWTLAVADAPGGGAAFRIVLEHT